MSISGKIYIILVNYNGWKDTVECIESILRNDYPSYQIIVCDNASADGSLEHIRQWAEGKITVQIDDVHPLKDLSSPPAAKPVAYTLYSYKDLRDGTAPLTLSADPLILIDTGSNLGFAGGNNAGVRFAQIKNDYSYIWFLNNDTVIEHDSLEQLAAYAEDCKKQGEKTGIIGSKLLYYDRPDTIQAAGGIYYRTIAYSRHIGAGRKDIGQFDNAHLKMDYVVGASMLVSKEYIDDVGLMAEDYFIYYEETDWIARGRKKGWKNGYAWKSRVYHKEGASIGANTQKKTKSNIAVYYFFRSAMLFTQRYCPVFLITVYLRFFATMIVRLFLRDMGKVNAMLKAVTGRKF